MNQRIITLIKNYNPDSTMDVLEIRAYIRDNEIENLKLSLERIKKFCSKK